MPCCASSVARVSAAALVAEASSTTVHASLPAGQSAISGVVPEPSSVAGGIVVDPGVTVGATGAGEGVAVAAGRSATCSGSPASSTSARMTAATAMAKRTPTSATGPRQLVGPRIVVGGRPFVGLRLTVEGGRLRREPLPGRRRRALLGLGAGRRARAAGPEDARGLGLGRRMRRRLRGGGRRGSDLALGAGLLVERRAAARAVVGVAGVELAALGARAADAGLAQHGRGVRLPEARLDRRHLAVERSDPPRLGRGQLVVRLLSRPARGAMDLVREPAEVAEQQLADVAKVAQAAPELAAPGAGGRTAGQVAGVDARGKVAPLGPLRREGGRLVGRGLRLCLLGLRRGGRLRLDGRLRPLGTGRRLLGGGLLSGRRQDLRRLLVRRGQGAVAARLGGGVGRRGGPVGGPRPRGPRLLGGARGVGGSGR